MNGTINISQLLMLFIPLVILQIGLMIWALVDCVKREYVTGGNKVVWILVIILLNLIGPILYFILGRQDKPSGDAS
ncbi:MAG: PLDc N-terminal domain-containing protein [Dehalococcoidia bacterium]|nr:PLDc N-terminal domain-containing protein [Dehalococcoidia bacterium]